jgi:hypothetical protein
MRAAGRALITMMLAGAAAVWPASSALAQEDPPGVIARLSETEGAVSLRAAGLPDWSAAQVNQPLSGGEQLWSDAGSRAEIDLGTAVVRFDENSSLSLLSLTDQLVQLQLNAGNVQVIVRELDPAAGFEIDAPFAALGLLRPGEYRLSVDGAGTTSIAVHNGQAQASPGQGPEMNLQTGQRAVFGANGSYAIMPMTAPDEFDLWCQQREADWADAASNGQYVSSDAVGYQDLDQYGNWQAEPDYGEVWFPSQLAVDWVPYGDGRWAWVSPWGWTWIDQARWGFAPFHYGRWAFINGHWGWVPPAPRHHAVYAPALVAWVGGPGAGAAVSLGGGTAVGWLPLAPGEVYVPGYGVSARYLQQVNLSNTAGLSASTISSVAHDPALQYRYVNRAVPRALTVVPQTAFTAGESVRRNRIAPPGEFESARATARVLAIAPARESVTGPVSLNRIGRPPQALLNRRVVTRREPPPIAPGFELQRSAVQANGGLPLSAVQWSRLRAAEPRRYDATPEPTPAALPASTPAAAGSARSQYRGIPERSASFQPPAELQHREPSGETARAPTTEPLQGSRAAQPRLPPAASAPPALVAPPPPPPPPQAQPKASRRPAASSEQDSRGPRPP